jgi:hypothetical protein
MRVNKYQKKSNGWLWWSAVGVVVFILMILMAILLGRATHATIKKSVNNIESVNTKSAAVASLSTGSEPVMNFKDMNLNDQIALEIQVAYGSSSNLANMNWAMTGTVNDGQIMNRYNSSADITITSGKIYVDGSMKMSTKAAVKKYYNDATSMAETGNIAVMVVSPDELSISDDSGESSVDESSIGVGGVSQNTVKFELPADQPTMYGFAAENNVTVEQLYTLNPGLTADNYMQWIGRDVRVQ